MSISIFYTKDYKNLEGWKERFLKGKAVSCKDGELESFLPIMEKFAEGPFPGSKMALKRRIRRDEFNKYPIIFITSDCFKDSARTNIHICAIQENTPEEWYDHCLSFENRVIDRKTGVIILEKTEFHYCPRNFEPKYSNWVFEKDEREGLPVDVLRNDIFTEVDLSKKEKSPGYFLSIKEFIPIPKDVNPEEYENAYRTVYGYLYGPNIQELVAKNTFAAAESSKSCSLIELTDGTWNFVVKDAFGHKIFKVSSAEVSDFLISNGLSYIQKVKETFVTTLQEGDVISCKGYKFTVKKVISCDYMGEYDPDHPNSSWGFFCEFIAKEDEKYHYWKQYIDGGTVYRPQ